MGYLPSVRKLLFEASQVRVLAAVVDHLWIVWIVVHQVLAVVGHLWIVWIVIRKVLAADSATVRCLCIFECHNAKYAFGCRPLVPERSRLLITGKWFKSIHG